MEIKEEIRRARQLAQDMRGPFVAGDAVMPDEMEQILKACGFSIFIDTGTHVAFVEKKDAEKILHLPFTTTENRDRMFMSLNLGCWVLYGREFGNDIHDTPEMERAIFSFVSEFLMPKDKFSKYAKSVGYDSKKIGAHFLVSECAAMCRCIALGLKMKAGNTLIDTRDGTTTVIEDEGQEQMPEQARREAWRCIRRLVAVWVLILVVGTWAAIEIFG